MANDHRQGRTGSVKHEGSEIFFDEESPLELI
jgi:hypothetical protein